MKNERVGNKLALVGLFIALGGVAVYERSTISETFDKIGKDSQPERVEITPRADNNTNILETLGLVRTVEAHVSENPPCVNVQPEHVESDPQTGGAKIVPEAVSNC